MTHFCCVFIEMQVLAMMMKQYVFFVSIIFLAVALLPLQHRNLETLALSLNNQNCSSRRHCCFVVTNAMSCIFHPFQADAIVVRGAAELDLEYYIRDLVGGNKKEGNILPSQGPPPPPPRLLQEPILSLVLLNDDCSKECLTTEILIQMIDSSKSSVTINNNDKLQQIIEKKIQEGMIEYRERSLKSFSAREPWITKRVTDQYYFDVTAYALWRTAADLLPNYLQRDLFVRKLGQSIFIKLATTESTTTKQTDAPKQRKGSLVDSIPSLIAILDSFTKSNFCTGYRLGEKQVTLRKNDINRNKDDVQQPLFDEYDDDTLNTGGTVDCLISIFEPITLGSSLQIIGEQSRFVTDYIAPTLSAMWEQKYNIKSTWETYFVDPVYRPNPKGLTRFERKNSVYYAVAKRNIGIVRIVH